MYAQGLDPSVIAQNPLNVAKTNADVNAVNTQTAQSQQMQPYKVKAAQLENQTSQLTQLKTKNDLALSYLSTSVDQNSYTQALNAAKQNGLDVSRFPPNYDPLVIRQAMYAGMTAAQRINDQLRALSIKSKTALGGLDPADFDLYGNPSAASSTPPSLPAASPAVAPPSSPAQQGNPIPSTQVAPTGLQPSASSAMAPVPGFKDPTPDQGGLNLGETTVMPTPPAAYAAQAAGTLPTGGQVGGAPVTPQMNDKLASAVSAPQIMDEAHAAGQPVTYTQAQQGSVPVAPIKPRNVPTSLWKAQLANDPQQQANLEFAKENAKGQAQAGTVSQIEQNKKAGEGYGDYITATNAAAANAPNQINLLNQIRADTESWTSGKGAYNMGQARLLLKAAYQAVGANVPKDLDQEVADQGSFEKNVGTILRQAVRDTSSRAAVQEYNMIGKTLPNDGTDHGTLLNVTAQLQGQQQYNLAKQQALTAYLNDPKSAHNLQDFQTQFDQKLTPGVFALQYLSPQQKETMFANIAKEAGGIQVLQNLRNGLAYATQNGLLK